MKPYPLGIDNPIKVKGVFGSHKWAIYWADDMTKIATFNSQFQAYEARRAILGNQKIATFPNQFTAYEARRAILESK